MLRTARAQTDTLANRLAALRKRHDELSEKIDDARVHRSISDFYLNELKKQKLHLKDVIEAMRDGGVAASA
jgi:hypothetical protein